MIKDKYYNIFDNKSSLITLNRLNSGSGYNNSGKFGMVQWRVDQGASYLLMSPQ